MNDTNKNFYNPEEFEFLQPLKDSWKSILDEFRSLEERNLHPWPEFDLYQQVDFKNKKINSGKGWDTFGLYAFGKENKENCELCPITTEILELFPTFPTTVGFSQLQSNTHILPHFGYSNYSSRVFRTHLGLEIPKNNSTILGMNTLTTRNIWFEKSIWKYDPQNIKGCCLRVNDDISTWKEGELMVFDDSYNHEAWNFCNERRTVLLVDFNRPYKYISNLKIKDNYNEKLYFDHLTEKKGYI